MEKFDLKISKIIILFIKEDILRFCLLQNSKSLVLLTSSWLILHKVNH